MRGGSNATVVKDDRGVKEEADVSTQIADLIRKKNSVTSPIARKNIDSQIALLKRKRDKSKDVNEMDKSPEANPYHGWGHGKSEISNGPDKTGKPITAKKATKDAGKMLNKAFKKEFNEDDKRPSYVVKASDKPKKIKPSMGGESPHPYQGKLVGATESSQWGEPEDVLRQVLQTLEREVEWPLTDVMDPQEVKQLLSPLMQAVSQKLNSLDEAEVSNTDYEFTHGKKPGGQGSWFFVAHRGGINFSKDVEGEDYVELHGMSYGDAKKAAVKWAKSKGYTSLFVAT
jgi:hypothetical protein